MKKDRGFTIVELLIVIVVIAILAAIIIVAYQGVTARANLSKAQTNAVSVQKKAEAYNADTSGGNGVYPATSAIFNGLAAGTLGGLPAGVTTVPPSTALTSTTGTTTVQYTACATGAANSNTATGYIITYYNYPSSGSPISIWGGSATSATCPGGTTASTS